MERTPKTRNITSLSVNKKENEKKPDHSTPEESTSRNVRRITPSEQISPIGSPGRSERLSQEFQVYWGWKSPDDITIQKSGDNLKTDLTPKACYYKYLSPKPKRKLIRQNYSDQVLNWADEFKSLQEELKTVAGKSVEKLSKVQDDIIIEQSPEKVCSTVYGEVIVAPETDVAEHCVNVEVVAQNTNKAILQDCLVVELTQGLNSLKSFPPSYQFPKVPKLDLENDMNKSDYVILMEDNSIEDELIKCTQQIEEEILGQTSVSRKEKLKTSESDNNMTKALNKFTDYITSPKSATSPLIANKSPVLNRRLPPVRKCVTSPKNGSNLNSSKRLDMKVSWEEKCETVNMKKLESNKVEEVMCMLEDDSFDNIMLELVVEGEKSISPPAVSHNKENKNAGSSSETNSKSVVKVEDKLKTGDSFGMLEDDSLIQPDVLNFLDSVESEAIAASQPLKCTPEEIQKKMVEAKKKLAFGKRKRKSQLACNRTSSGIVVTPKGQVNR